MLNSSPLEVAVAVIEREGLLLISQRKEGDSFAGYWEFPGGKMHVGESLEVCLTREIQEELGIEIAVGGKRMVIEHRYPGRTIRFHCYDCRIRQGEPQAIECASWRWVRPGDLELFRFPPASTPLLKALKSGTVPFPECRVNEIEPGTPGNGTGF